MISCFLSKLFALLFFIQCALCQSLITDIDKDSKDRVNKISYYKESPIGIELVKEKIYYKSGALKKEIAYKQSLIHGKLVSYYPNGKKQSEKLYQLGKERTSKFYTKDGLSMRPINILGNWVVSDIPPIEDIPFKIGYMLQFTSHGLVSDSKNSERKYELIGNELIFPERICKSTGFPLSFIISQDNQGFTLFADPFQCPERSKGATTDNVWVVFSPMKESIEEIIKQESEEIQGFIIKLLPGIASFVNDELYNNRDDWFDSSFYNVFNSSDDMSSLGINPLLIKEDIIENWDLDIEIDFQWHESEYRFVSGIDIEVDHIDRGGELYGYYNLNTDEYYFTDDWSDFYDFKNQLKDLNDAIKDTE